MLASRASQQTHACDIGLIVTACTWGEGTGRWNRETSQLGTISQGWTSRDLFQCSSRCSLQVYVWFSEYYMSCSSVYVYCSISFCFTYSYVRQTKLVNVWAHYKIVIVVWLIDRSISKSFLCHHCVVLYTVYVFYVHTAPVRSQQHVAPRCTLRNSRPRLLPLLLFPIPTPWSCCCWHGRLPVLVFVLAAVAAAALSTRGCRDSVWVPTEWLTARRNCRRL